jgi:cysteine-rich repeat protein
MNVNNSCVCQSGYRQNGTNCYVVCGDGIIISGEGCDDGNRIDGDGCSAACTE